MAALELLPYLSFNVVGFLICLWAFAPKHMSPSDRRAFAQIVFWFPFTPFLLYHAFTAVFELSGSVDDRFFGTTAHSVAFFRHYISAQGIGTVVELCADTDNKTKFSMVLHHLVSIIAYCNAVHTDRMHFWGCLDGLCEVSTVFLNVVLLSKTKSKSAEFINTRLSSLVTLNGILLWLAFIAFRLCLFPLWLWYFFQDLHSGGPRVDPSSFSIIELVGYPASNVILLVLSWLWFTRLTKGMVKQIRKQRSKQH